VTSCAHPNRISGRGIRRLTKASEPFVLVFGSVSTPRGTLARPTIRFVHQADGTAPEYLLWSLVISSGDRFYAVLQVPPAIPYLDTFYAEVGSADTAFDKITFVRLREGDAPVAIYFGEIRLNPAQNRSAQGQRVVVNIRDDFQNAERQLRRLYPGFAGTVTRAGFLRDRVPGRNP
jgi:hypothetical protein